MTLKPSIATPGFSTQAYSWANPRKFAAGFAAWACDQLGARLLSPDKDDSEHLRKQLAGSEESLLIQTLERAYGPGIDLERLVLALRYVTATMLELRNDRRPTIDVIAPLLGVAPADLLVLELSPGFAKLASDMAIGLLGNQVGQVYLRVWGKALAGDPKAITEHLTRFDPEYSHSAAVPTRRDVMDIDPTRLTEAELMAWIKRLRKEVGELPACDE